jgi:single-strand DNA-binding protein
MKNMRNSVRLVGNVGIDPRITTYESGKKKASMVMATNERYKNGQGEWVTDTQWHQVVAWGREAAIIEKFVEKGKEVSIEGKLVHRSYTDKDGSVKNVTEIVVNDLLFMQAARRSDLGA